MRLEHRARTRIFTFERLSHEEIKNFGNKSNIIFLDKFRWEDKIEKNFTKIVNFTRVTYLSMYVYKDKYIHDDNIEFYEKDFSS